MTITKQFLTDAAERVAATAAEAFAGAVVVSGAFNLSIAKAAATAAVIAGFSAVKAAAAAFVGNKDSASLVPAVGAPARAEPWRCPPPEQVTSSSGTGATVYVNTSTPDTPPPASSPAVPTPAKKASPVKKSPTASKATGKKPERPAHVPSTGDVKPPYRERSGR